jgi:hypothetical protein
MRNLRRGLERRLRFQSFKLQSFKVAKVSETRRFTLKLYPFSCGNNSLNAAEDEERISS